MADGQNTSRFSTGFSTNNLYLNYKVSLGYIIVYDITKYGNSLEAIRGALMRGGIEIKREVLEYAYHFSFGVNSLDEKETERILYEDFGIYFIPASVDFAPQRLVPTLK